MRGRSDRGGLARRLICSTQSTRQRHMVHLRHDDSAAGVLKSGDETELALESSYLVPGEPETVRGSQARLAVVFGEVLYGKEKLLLRCRIVRVRVFVVECVDGQLPVDLNGLLRVFCVEYQSPAEPAHTRLACMMQYRVAPHSHHAFGNLRLEFRVHPGQGVAQLHSRTSAKQRRSQNHREATCSSGATIVVCVSFLAHSTCSRVPYSGATLCSGTW